MDESEKWCPTQGGARTGWRPEYFDPEADKWHEVPTFRANGSEFVVPMAMYGADILHAIDMYTHAEAMALAWLYAADAEAAGKQPIRVRAQRYKVVYNIKAQKECDEPETAEAKP